MEMLSYKSLTAFSLPCPCPASSEPSLYLISWHLTLMRSMVSFEISYCCSRWRISYCRYESSSCNSRRSTVREMSIITRAQQTTEKAWPVWLSTK